jgi:hypothetical protein
VPTTSPVVEADTPAVTSPRAENAAVTGAENAAETGAGPGPEPRGAGIRVSLDPFEVTPRHDLAGAGTDRP